ncbi:MAG TPA: peptidoglycan DD-metalloendopeptidase family protein, partial [Burkholderiales bacterium]|nr:peptidoglycan DD-metalloendopeptidase family protein [Burkholderiales bacterium]
MGRLGPFARSAAIAVLAVSGVVGAFATIAPSTEAELALSTKRSVETLPIPLEALLPAPESYIREEVLRRGDTLPAFLGRLGIVSPYAEQLAKLRVLQVLRPGQYATAEVSAEGQPLSLSFLASGDTLVQIALEGDGFTVSEERAALYKQVAMKSGVVHTSLFAASDAAGIPDSVAMQLADIFGGDIDFHRDLRKGDQFTVVYELHHLAGRPVRAGRVLAAEFISQGRTYRAIQFGSSYYTPDGKNMRKAFLRAPLEFSRISSGFGMRKHPIARTWLNHQGVDYAAPTGTRVRAVGDAVVEFAGMRGGYGNVVILRHHGAYTTVYAHLSRIAVKR